jgi:hypothetical protein
MWANASPPSVDCRSPTRLTATGFPSRTDYRISRADVEKAFQLVPLDGPGAISSIVRGPTRPPFGRCCTTRESRKGRDEGRTVSGPGELPAVRCALGVGSHGRRTGLHVPMRPARPDCPRYTRTIRAGAAMTNDQCEETTASRSHSGSARLDTSEGRRMVRPRPLQPLFCKVLRHPGERPT